MHLDNKLSPQQATRAALLLRAAGFQRADDELCATTSVRTIIWALGGASPRRRKTVAEIIDTVAEAA